MRSSQKAHPEIDAHILQAVKAAGAVIKVAELSKFDAASYLDDEEPSLLT